MAAIAWFAVALGFAAPLGTAHAAAPPAGCGRPGLVGLGSRATLGADGALTLALTLSDGPLDPLPVRPLVFVDGILRVDGDRLDLPCGREVVWATPATGVRHALHWTLMPWPAVPPALAAMTPDEAQARFADSDPPGLYPWADVELLRPRGAAPAAHPDPVAAQPAPAHELSDDRVDVLAADGEPVAARIVRVEVGAAFGFRLRYLAGEFGADPLIATCLLDDAQVDAFAGRAFAAATPRPGEALEVDGVVEVARPGWHRLHCLLLPDVPGEHPPTWPRPVLGVYLWGDP